MIDFVGRRQGGPTKLTATADDLSEFDLVNLKGSQGILDGQIKAAINRKYETMEEDSICPLIFTSNVVDWETSNSLLAEIEKFNLLREKEVSPGLWDSHIILDYMQNNRGS